MKESVSAIFVTESKIFFIKRQNFLSVFPGYFATPGGKVDQEDYNPTITADVFPKTIPNHLINALIREINEELGFDLRLESNLSKILKVDFIGTAITPEFNPYRFKNFYFRISLIEEIEFELDKNEAEYGDWFEPSQLLNKYENGEVLAVPPLIMLLTKFNANIEFSEVIELTLPHDPETEVPMIESICGVRQFLPLSNTFPPANRTNSFIIGDNDQVKILIDPSPKNEQELSKFLRSVDKIGFDKIMLTHHHPDHYEFSNQIARKYNVDMLMSEDTYNRIGKDYFLGIKVHFIKEGDILTKSLGHDVLVYEVPGHDEGQLALAPTSMEWFLAGDLIQTVGTVAVLAPEGNMKKYFHSLEKVINLNPKNIIPSHGIILGGVHKLIETLEHRKMRERQIISLLHENKTLEEMLEIIYPQLELRLRKYALKTLESHLTKIIEEEKSFYSIN